MFVFLTSPGVPNDENIEMVQIDPNENIDNVLNKTTVQIADDTDEDENTGSLITHLLKEIKQYFNWSDFFFGLIFGLAPTGWDMYTDLWLGSELLHSENAQAAGLCYVFICLPGINLIKERVGEAVMKSQCGAGVLLSGLIMGLYFALGTALIVGLGMLVWIWPLVLFYPAVLVTVAIVFTKTVAVVLHSPRMKRLSLQMSESECCFESNLQLTLLIHIWLSGGKVYATTIFSSVLVIGKVGAENLLKEQLKDKGFWGRLLLTAKFIPVIALTAVFRLGSGALFRCLHSLSPSHNLISGTTPVSFFLQVPLPRWPSPLSISSPT